MIYIMIAAGICIAEILLKGKAEKELKEGVQRRCRRLPVILEKHHNYGFAGNKMEEKPAAVKWTGTIIMAVVVICFFLLLPVKGRKGLKTGAALLFGGGLSNLTDRFVRGYVVDYFRIRTPFPKVNWFIFNLADFCLFTGAVIVLLASFWKDEV
ncbi:lipoprotein signal peptidase [uncultured Roseburia sp.]|uniref:Signal peptidase II n=1 Tax=Brotonthovivens ammoniilytica TaxID=2981725 RepID=A0ABT2TG08_9FIRM|nr:signal peptidase II [Brotonthovivens ammoniilytica]MCU6761119.1 signal peptidase II [Brotonthovivens ammoniilytica]SCI19462.1 lipoprotein signal peptidase [uncultured Roseburia sp.]